MLLLNNTTDELDPVFHEYFTFGPPTEFTETKETVPLHASDGVTGVPTELEGGPELTRTTSDAQEEFPHASSILT